jgi:hypothetical protein
MSKNSGKYNRKDFLIAFCTYTIPVIKKKLCPRISQIYLRRFVTKRGEFKNKHEHATDLLEKVTFDLFIF